MKTNNIYFIRLVEGPAIGDPETTVSFALLRERQFEDTELGYDDYDLDSGDGYPVYRLTGVLPQIPYAEYMNPKDSLKDYVDEAIEIAEDIVGKKFTWIRKLSSDDLDIDTYGSYNVARTI